MMENTQNQIYLEGMTSISALIGGIRAGVNGRRILEVFVDEQKARAKAKELGFLHAVSSELGFSLTMTDAQAIDGMTNGTTHGGIVAACTERPIPQLEKVVESDAPWSKPDGFFAILEGIEDPYNFGYAIRSLYAAGADGIVLSPRNWMSAASVVARSSAGASELLPMVECESEAATALLKTRSYRVICAGIRNSVSLYKADMRRPLLLVVGGEKRGISRGVLDMADQIVRIDYGREFRGSLPSASATSVLAFEVLRQNGGKC